MNLDDYCAKYWKTDHRDENADNLFVRIKSYQAKTLSDVEVQELVRYILCSNGKIRRIWNVVKKIILKETVSFYRQQKDRAIVFQQLNACCSEVIKMKVEKCLSKCDLNRLENQTNTDTLRLISGFISDSVHKQNVLKELGIDYISRQTTVDRMIDSDEFQRSEPNPELLVMLEHTFEKIILKEKGFQIAQAHLTLTDFINESRTRQTKSARARQQKKRLKNFFKDKWELDDLLAAYLTEKIEYLLGENKI